MIRICAVVSLLATVSVATGQIAAPNAAGVSMGHLHFVVDDVAANRAFWIALGGRPWSSSGDAPIELPGFVVVISERGAGAGDGESAVIDHVAFRVDSLARLEADGFELERLEAFPGIASISAPSGDPVELFEEGTATNVWFEAGDGSIADSTTGRHNRPIDGSLDAHHLHFYVAEADVSAARDWYVGHFGAVPGTRWRYAAADLPGMNLNFSASAERRGATNGQSLDHIGFEVENLERFSARLEAAGIEFEQPYRRTSAGLGVAVLTDPWGTTIELTEGLR